MGDMTLVQYQSAVIRALANVQADHPLIVAGDHTRCINGAADDLIRKFPTRFPEHRDRSWSTETTVSKNLFSLPTNLLVLDRIRHSDGEALPVVDGAPDWSSIEEVIVSPSSVATITLLNKDTTVADYPRLYARKGTNVLYHPTTRTGFTTPVRLYGISREIPLSAPGDTFRMDRDYDEVIVLFGAAKLARLIGYSERAVELEAAALRQMGEGLSVTLYEAMPVVLDPHWDFNGWGAD